MIFYGLLVIIVVGFGVALLREFISGHVDPSRAERTYCPNCRRLTCCGPFCWECE